MHNRRGTLKYSHSPFGGFAPNGGIARAIGNAIARDDVKFNSLSLARSLSELRSLLENRRRKIRCSATGRFAFAADCEV